MPLHHSQSDVGRRIQPFAKYLVAGSVLFGRLDSDLIYLIVYELENVNIRGPLVVEVDKVIVLF